MKPKEFNLLLNKNKVQIFLFQSACSIPFSLGVHTWFVVSDGNGLNRFEAGTSLKLNSEKSWGRVYLNKYGILDGINIFPFINIPRFDSKLIGVVEEGEDMLASKMRDTIINESPNYKYKNNYSIFGPNSNTYTQWILNSFPESKLKLPLRAFGKNIIFKTKGVITPYNKENLCG